MKNVLSNALRLFLRNQEFISMLTSMPVLIFLALTLLLPYNSKHSIAVINRTDDKTIENALNDIDGITIQDIDEDKITERLIAGNIDIAVVIDRDAEGNVFTQIMSAGENEISGAVRLAVQNASEKESSGAAVSINKSKMGKREMGCSSAFMIYKFIQGGVVLGSFLIIERRKRMKDRIMLSGISSNAYIGGVSIVFFLGSAVGAVIYYLTAVILNFNFGMKNSIDYLLMVMLANVFAVAFAVFLASFFDNEHTNDNASMAILTVLGFFSGIFFPYEYMPKAFKAIGMLSPQRWVSQGIEKIQEKGTFFAASGEIAVILGLSAVLYVIGMIRNGKKLAK